MFRNGARRAPAGESGLPGRRLQDGGNRRIELPTGCKAPVWTPVILITGYPDENIAAKARSAGVHQVLYKPHLEDSLVATVRNAINPGSSQSA